MNDEPKDLFPADFDPDGSPLQRKTHEVVARATKFVNRKTGTITDVMDRVGEGSSQLDLFVAHLLDANIKDDVATMGVPIYALSTKDTRPFRWESLDKQRWLEITPSVLGRATMHDKDLLIYLTSVMVQDMDAALRQGLPMPSRRVTLNAHDFFVKTKKDTGGTNYTNLSDTLKRLRGTTITTNIASLHDEHGFGLIEDYRIERVPGETGETAYRTIEVWLSRRLYEALQQREVLTLHSDYFNLRKPIEKRLYELARKHLGREMQYWPCNEDTLYNLVGTRATPRRFHNMMLDIMTDSNLPEFVIINKQLANKDWQWQFWLRAPRGKKTRLRLGK
jgi:plasmid replication initiation protein